MRVVMNNNVDKTITLRSLEIITIYVNENQNLKLKFEILEKITTRPHQIHKTQPHNCEFY